MYNMTSFNKIWEINDEECVLFNSLSKTTLKLSKESINDLRNGNWENFDIEMLELMLIGYIISHEGISSRDIYKFELVNGIAKKDRLGIYFVPSRRCNLACSYCIQNNLFDEKENMEITPEIIDKYYDWLQEKINLWNVKEITGIFYGGEPLTTNKNTFKYLLEKFDELEVKPKYTMITNGVNIVEYSEIFEKIKYIQVTLDGNKEIHDSRRIFKNGSGSYDLIMEGLKKYLLLSKDHKATVRFNIDKTNRDNILEDLKNIINELPIDQINVNISPVDSYSEGINDTHIHGDIRVTAKIICECYEYLSQYNIEPQIWQVGCGVQSFTQWSFDTEGSIYKCPGHTGFSEYAVTSVFKNSMNSSFLKIMNRQVSDECINCCYIGICNGGCYHQEQIQQKTPCRKDLFDEVIPRMTNLKYGIK